MHCVCTIKGQEVLPLLQSDFLRKKLFLQTQLPENKNTETKNIKKQRHGIITLWHII